MRVRLFCLGERWAGQILWLDAFPITLSEDTEGCIRTAVGETGHPLCRFEEQRGNLVFVSLDAGLETCVNSDPIEQGGLIAGDILTIGGRQFLISYERTTSHPLPRRRYRMATAASV